MEKTPDLQISASIIGGEEVQAGLDRIAVATENVGERASVASNKIAASSKGVETNYRGLMMASAGLIANSVQLGDIMDRMAKGQIDLGRGALMLAMNFLQLASMMQRLVTAENIAIATKWAHTVALHAHAIALAISNALSGPYGWAILVGAAAAAAVGISMAATIPTRHEGGPIFTSGPYNLLAGEYVSKSASSITNVSKGAPSITINIYESGTPRETGNAVIDALRRSGVL